VPLAEYPGRASSESAPGRVTATLDPADTEKQDVLVAAARDEEPQLEPMLSEKVYIVY
jgi:hypothetical protein